MRTKIIQNVPLGVRYHSMDFEWPDEKAQPGQFIMVRVNDSNDPLLRRPMSIAGLKNGGMNIIYAVAGRGTAMLAEKTPGDFIDVIGPFGTAFDPPASAQNLLCVMGGVGAAPFVFYKDRNPGKKMTAFFGAANKDGLGIPTPFEETIFATEDGSVGTKGLVTEVLLSHPAVKDSSSYVMACGPKGMLKAVDDICVKNKIPGELSLEERMGCGFGVCLGCVVGTPDGNKRVCVEGPVFKAGGIKW
jgi:dihydroorotate dehydrogenase electron transfer subunit